MRYDMVFEGGGAKGVVFVGALKAFEARGHSAGRVLGTSAGAIFATLLAAGYGGDEMIEGLEEHIDGRWVFSSFMGPPRPFEPREIDESSIYEVLASLDMPFVPAAAEERLDRWLAAKLANHPTFRHVFSLVERGGWYSADPFVTWFKRRLDMAPPGGAPRDYGDHTFAQLHAATGVDLSVVAADITGHEMLILNHRTAPDLPVAWAVRMSMSIPLLWPEVQWEPGWGTYMGRDMRGHAIVDGGLLSNFPIALFASRDPAVTEVMGDVASPRILGLNIDDDTPVANAPPNPQKGGGGGGGLDRLRASQRLADLVNTAIGARDKSVAGALSRFVVNLPAGGYETAEFDMTAERRKALVQSGIDAMQAYLDKEESAAGLSFGAGDEGELALPPAARRQADADARKLLRGRG